MSEPRSNILARVDRKLTLREITQSVPATIIVELPLNLTEGAKFAGAQISSVDDGAGKSVVSLVVEIE